MNGAIINNTKAVVSSVVGENKAEKVDLIINQKEGSTKYPAALVKPITGNLTWFLDQSAASLL